MLRTIYVAINMIIMLLLILIMYPFFWVIGLFSKKARSRATLFLVQNGFRIFTWHCGVKVTVKGKENIPTDHPVLFVGNHRSFFDILVCYQLVKTPTGFIAKKSMEKLPLVSWYMPFVHCLFLDRDNIKEGFKTILQGISYVKEGISLWIFPEGTRNKVADLPLLPFKEGALKIAEKTGCPVIPVAITGTAAIFEDHFPIVKGGPVTVTFGTPIILQDLPKEDRKFPGSYTQKVIEHMLEKELTAD